jgi:2-oxoglutarate ferredoxin oxidoreductase subunit gamma
VPANSIAEQLGSLRSANMVMLGAFTKNSNIVSISSVIEGLKSALKKKQKLIAVNTKALMAGYDLF